jgi:DNA-binding MarR family transcriptional regulator
MRPCKTSVYFDRFKSTNPPIWDSRKADPFKQSKQELAMAKKQVALLEAIKNYPGESVSFYAKKVGISPHYCRPTLAKFHKDGLVYYQPTPGRGKKRLWYLMD